VWEPRSQFIFPAIEKVIKLSVNPGLDQTTDHSLLRKPGEVSDAKKGESMNAKAAKKNIGKSAKLDLHASEEKFKFMFEHSIIAKSFTLPSGEIDANQAFCDLLGYSQDELQNKRWQNISHPEDIEPTQKAIDKLLSREQDSVRLTKRYLSKAGSVIWAEVSTSLRRDETGQPLYFMIEINDITERKQAEQEMALRLRFEMLLAEIQADFLAMPAEDVDQAILSAQRKLCELFGTDRSALWQGSADEPENLRMTHLCTLDEIPPVPEGVTTNILFPWFTEQLLAMQIVIVPDVHALPPEAATDSKNLIYYGDKSTLAIPFSSGEPPVFGALSFAATTRSTHWSEALLAHCQLVAQVFSGVLARKQVEDEVRKLNAELEARVEARTRELCAAQEQLIQQEKLAVLGRLAGGVSQELRNPLGVINNAIYYLRLVQPEADETIKEYLGIIEAEANTADKIIADLLDYSSPKFADRELVNVFELTQRVLNRHPAPPSIQLKLEIPSDLPPIFADPRQVEQVLGNLVVNACQAMPEGGELTLKAFCQQQMVAIAVKDTGIGIPPENMAKLFEPLFTTKSKGIGLGLAICKKLVEANGGGIEVESEVGMGSTFTIFFPVKAEAHL
jgi:PAS domain S-box-containing protein